MPLANPQLEMPYHAEALLPGNSPRVINLKYRGSCVASCPDERLACRRKERVESFAERICSGHARPSRAPCTSSGTEQCQGEVALYHILSFSCFITQLQTCFYVHGTAVINAIICTHDWVIAAGIGALCMLIFSCGRY